MLGKTRSIVTGLFLFGAMAGVMAAELRPPQVRLTEAEKAFLQKAGSIRLCVDPDWMPFERINAQGLHEGIAADLVQLIASRVGMRLEVLQVPSWEASLAASKAGKCQVMSFVNQTPEREAWLKFTEPVFYDQNVIITREEHPYIGDLHGVAGATVALPAGTMVEERIRSDYPNLTVIATGSEAESIALVSARRADMTIRSLMVAAYSIKQEGLFNLKIAGQLAEHGNRMRIGVLKSEPLLHSILEKGVQTLTPQEREAIANRHVAVRVEQRVDYLFALKILLVSSLLLAGVIVWNRKLSRLNRELERLSVTDRLTGLFNRLRLDETLAGEILRAQRYGQPFAVILLDLDHFKEVNDRFGHQAGDAVLVEAARLLGENSRKLDIVGRWGGEEFLLICPHTDQAGACRLAENLCRLFAAHLFPVVGQQTASFGVAAYLPGEQANDVVGRADEALYKAKLKGRNRAETLPPLPVA